MLHISSHAILKFVIIILPLKCSKAVEPRAKIDLDLLTLLESGGRANVIVTFVDSSVYTRQRLDGLNFRDRNNTKQVVVQELRIVADKLQLGVVQILSNKTLEKRDTRDPGFQYYKQYWLGNKVFVKAANAETVLSVAKDSQVLRIRKEVNAKIPETYSPPSLINSFPNLISRTGGLKDKVWGLNMIKVRQAWRILGGKKGEGVIVGTIDTGVAADHEALRDNFVGVNYGWFDAIAGSAKPVYGHKHGTHTLGTLVGKYDIGVAPGAKWMTCRGCASARCSTEAILDCMQWIACPTLPDGSNPDCSKAPQIVSNSWNSGRAVQSYDEEIHGWRTLGIIPVFSIGNRGSECGTTETPGELSSVIGVGVTDENDYLWENSAIGFSSHFGIKPDLVAPGRNILSSVPQRDWIAYEADTGSSMSTPHVAGVIALLKVRDPDLTYEQAFEFLTKNADRTVFLNPKFKYCRADDIYRYPNIYAGYGRVNALKAVRAQTKALSLRNRK